MKLKKILWPTDFSGNSEKAAPYVRSLIQKYNAEVHVLYVIDDIAHHKSWYGEFENKRVEELTERLRSTAQKKLNMMCDKHMDGCPLFVRHVAVGDPAEEILKLIERENIEQVVMATHGQKGNFIYGSVTEKVLKHAKIPVTAIPIKPEVVM